MPVSKTKILAFCGPNSVRANITNNNKLTFNNRLLITLTTVTINIIIIVIIGHGLGNIAHSVNQFHFGRPTLL